MLLPARIPSGLMRAACVLNTAQNSLPDFFDTMSVKMRISLLSLALFVAAPAAVTPALAAPAALSNLAPIAQPQIASGSAMIVDLETNKVLFSSHPDRVRPIASLTKLMTAMVVLDAKLPMDEMLSVDISHTPEMRGVFSRVKLNSEISRRNMLLLALMSSENRAAASLAHHYPGGYDAFIRAMNAKARALGMTHTHYVEPTGLSIHNVSNAEDLIKLAKATRQYPLIGELSTTKEDTAVFKHPNYALPFRNTNHLVYKNDWRIALTKTGYTDEAGHCLVMRTVINNRPVALVVLDAFGKYTHFADANRLRDWLETGKAAPVPAAALAYKKQKSSQTASNE
jgi:serine-type D-Ala-D-Ala endopeptidase (penicillin-binding protein 7)